MVRISVWTTPNPNDDIIVPLYGVGRCGLAVLLMFMGGTCWACASRWAAGARILSAVSALACSVLILLREGWAREGALLLSAVSTLACCSVLVLLQAVWAREGALFMCFVVCLLARLLA